jgi:hypothetical protein
MEKKVKKAMVVYQGGMANLFEVKCFNLNPFGRNAKSIYQGTFDECNKIAFGMELAGAKIKVAGCNMAGDIQDFQWTDNLDDLPFSCSFQYRTTWT